MPGNRSLNAASRAKNDEFYTELADIDKELRHYRQHFKNKTVYCNCDDPRISNFFHYFSYNFSVLGLKKLIATCYNSRVIDLFSQNDSEQAVYLIYEGDKDGNRIPDPNEIQVLPLKGDGDFRSAECMLYNQFRDDVLDSGKLETEIKRLMLDDEVGNKKGIYPYVLACNEKYLNLRTFSDGMK